jgi:hypothetical protein
MQMMDRETLGKIVHDEMHLWRKEQAERLGKRPEQVFIALSENVTELEKRIGEAVYQAIKQKA